MNTKNVIGYDELKTLINNHNDWLKHGKNNKGKQLYIHNKILLKDMDLRGLDFTDAIIVRCDLSDSLLDNCNFTNAFLYSNNFTNASLENCNFTDADLSYSNLTGTSLKNSNFYKAIMISSILKHSRALFCNFTDADLTNVNLNDADLRNSNLHSANLFAVEYNKFTLFPQGTIILNGYHYNIFIHQGEEPSINDSYQVGCKVFTAEEWLLKSREELLEMDGRLALKFYPTLEEIIKFFSKL